jgi:hypothetical protein
MPRSVPGQRHNDKKQDSIPARAARRFKSFISGVSLFLILVCLAPYFMLVAVLAAVADPEVWRDD